MKKIAFCFLTYDNLSCPEIWEKFFAQADPKQYSIYVHAKYPENVTQDIVKNHLISVHCETGWGTFGFLMAMLTILNYPFVHDSSTYKAITISQSCIPIQSFQKVYEELTRHDKGYLGWYDDLSKYRQGQLKDPNFVSKENFSFCVDQGIVFTKQMNDFFNQHNNTELFQNMDSPNEHYFGTTLSHYGKEDWIEKKRLNLCENSGGGNAGGFSSMSEEKVSKLREEGYLFCRKYCPGAQIPDMCIQ